MTIPKQMIEAAAEQISDFVYGESIHDLGTSALEATLKTSEKAITAALATLWSDDMDSAPLRTPLITGMVGESGINLCTAVRGPEDIQAEWCECGSGRTTVTHHSFAAPTHFIDPSIFPLPRPKEGE